MLIPKPRAVRYESVPVDAACSFTVREFRWPRFPFNWHYHPEIELTLIVKGCGLRFVGDSVREFDDGDLCLLGANTPHCWASHLNAAVGAHSLVIQFVPQAWGEIFWQLPELCKVKGLLGRAQRGLAITGSTRRMASKGILELTRQPQGSSARLSTFLRILSVLAESRQLEPLAAQGSDEPPSRRVGDRLSRILGSIHANLGPDLAQAQVAQTAGMSSQSLSQFFRRTLGKTFGQYVNELKICRACRGLLETEGTITEIAYAAGFNNLSHFNAQFRRFKQMTPRAFRTRARQGVTCGALPSSKDWLGALK